MAGFILSEAKCSTPSSYNSQESLASEAANLCGGIHNLKYRKIACKFCQKLISATNLKKHKTMCVKKHKMCTYSTDGLNTCDQWIHTKDFEKHLRNHTEYLCKFCNKWTKRDDGEHEVACRLKDLERSSARNKYEKLEKEYDENYLKWCRDNDKSPKGIIPWLQGKVERKVLTAEEFQAIKNFLDGDKKKPTEKRKKPDDDDDKENEPEPKKKNVEKKKIKKRKSKTITVEDDDEEKQKYPSLYFQVTMNLKFVWVFNAIIRYITSTFFDGYYIPRRYEKTWSLGRRSTTLFPHPTPWRKLMHETLQRETPIRRKLRGAAKRNFEGTTLSRKYITFKFNIECGKKKYFRKRFISPIPLMQEFIASKEYGLDARLHCHMYIKATRKMYVNTLRLFFRRFKYDGISLLRKIGTIRSPKDWIRYITKEDYNAVVRNVDKETCNDNYIMWNFAKLDRACHISMYSLYRWPTQGKMNKYKEIHSAYWEPIIKEEAYNNAMSLLNPVEKDDIETIAKFCIEVKQKGIYLYGDPKTGKSTTALCITKGNHYQVPEGNTIFAFHSWKHEPFILFEDISATEFLHFRNKVNQLCDEHGLCFVQTKGGGSKLVTCFKLIVTSNNPPPSESDWPGFERRFLCIKYDKQKITRESINV